MKIFIRMAAIALFFGIVFANTKQDTRQAGKRVYTNTGDSAVIICSNFWTGKNLVRLQNGMEQWQ